MVDVKLVIKQKFYLKNLLRITENYDTVIHYSFIQQYLIEYLMPLRQGCIAEMNLYNNNEISREESQKMKSL